MGRGTEDACGPSTVVLGPQVPDHGDVFVLDETAAAAHSVVSFLVTSPFFISRR